MNIKLNDFVVVFYPSGNLRAGGKVLGIIQVQGKPAQYLVEFSNHTHDVFGEDQIFSGG